MISFGEFRFDPAAGVLVSQSGDEQQLEPRLAGILAYFLDNREGVISHDAIAAGVWGHEHVAQNTVHQYIGRLRKVLGDDLRSPRYIKTIPRRGYRFVAAAHPSGRHRYAFSGAIVVALIGLAVAIGVFLPRSPGKASGGFQLGPPALVSGKNGVNQSPAFSPDGRWLYYVRGKYSLRGFLRNLLTGQEMEVSPRGHRFGAAAWSPDSSQLAYLRSEPEQFPEMQIIVHDMESGNEKVLATGRFPAVGATGAGIDYSPDGSRLALTVAGEETGAIGLAVVDVDSGVVTPLSAPAFRDILPTWIDVDTLEFIRYSDRQHSDIARTDLFGEARLITDIREPMSGYARISDETYLVSLFRDSHWRLHHIDRNTGSSTRLDIEEGVVDPMVHDGRLYYRQNRAPSTVYRLPLGLDGEHVRVERLELSAGSADDPTVDATTGKIVYVSDRSGTAQIWSASPDGSDVAQITDFPGRTARPDVSPDGQWLAFEFYPRDGGSEIRVMSLKEDVLMTLPDRGAMPTWCRETGGLFTLAEGKIHFYPDIARQPRIADLGQPVSVILPHAASGVIASSAGASTHVFPDLSHTPMAYADLVHEGRSYYWILRGESWHLIDSEDDLSVLSADIPWYPTRSFIHDGWIFVGSRVIQANLLVRDIQGG